MKDKKGMSTAQRIQRLQTRRTKWVLFVVDLMLVFTTLVCWCYVHDSNYTGIYSPIRLISAVERGVHFSSASHPGLLWVGYSMRAPGLEAEIVDATGLLYVLMFAIPIVVLVQSLIVWIADLFAVQQVRHQLQPLYKLAEAAQELSEENYTGRQQATARTSRGAVKPAPAAPPPVYPDQSARIHTLENAIESMQPERPDARLYTGDKDLRGLEDAINSLLTRTRESYSQQIRFVSDASHELRTPIAVIKGYTDMLDRWGKKDEKVLEESIDAIKAETEHMNKLVEQLLFLARGDSGRTQLKMESFSLSDMVREVYEESVMIDAKHKWELYAKDEVVAFGDAAMLKQATRVLVDNAAKYTPEGQTVILRAVYDSKGDPAVVVQDNGVGIAGEDMEHVFERFFRSDPSRARKQGGTGLGLAIAKWIVDRHGGYFEILSREEIGTRITIHLPKMITEQKFEI